MVLDKKNKWEEKFGRWIRDDEIVIEDLEEKDILSIAEEMGGIGYNLEYWKAEKQKSGHLHIKNIKFPEKGKLTKKELQRYKELVIRKYVPKPLQSKVDFQVTHRHRIAEENKEHYKGYGKKVLVKRWNEKNINFCEEDLYFKSKIESIPTKKILLIEYEGIIKKIVPKWIKGNRQNLTLHLAGYLRKQERLGIESVKEIIKIICERAKDEELSMRIKAVDETFKKDESEIKGFKGLEGIFNMESFKEEINKGKKIKEITRGYQVRTYKDFKKLKKNNDFIVDEFLYPGTITMVYSPPAQFKSLLAYQLGFCISNEKLFLGMETKKSPVLYVDCENADLIIKERMEKIYNGLNLEKEKFPFYSLKNITIMDEKKNIHLGALIFLESFIEENNIKVLIIDTLHRTAFYDENKSDDINKLYIKFFKPLVDKYNLSIVFLHHSKKDGGYRGSGDFLGLVDVSYQIRREGKTNKFRIINEKQRSGEIQDISGEIYFDEEFIKMVRFNEKEISEKTISKLKEITLVLQEIFRSGKKYKRKELFDFLELKGISCSLKTVDRSLKFLRESLGYIDKDEKGNYSKIMR